MVFWMMIMDMWYEGFHLCSCPRKRTSLIQRQRHLSPVHSVTFLELQQSFLFSSPWLVLFNSVSVRWKWGLEEHPALACPQTPGTQAARKEYSAWAPRPFSWPPVCWWLPYSRAPSPQVPYSCRTWLRRWPTCVTPERLALSSFSSLIPGPTVYP